MVAGGNSLVEEVGMLSPLQIDGGHLSPLIHQYLPAGPAARDDSRLEPGWLLFLPSFYTQALSLPPEALASIACSYNVYILSFFLFLTL